MTRLALAVATDTDWMDQAACRSEGPDLFFEASGLDELHEPARRVCATCPVAGTCLEYALDRNIDHGVWGGATEKERRALRRNRALGLTGADRAPGMRPAREDKGLTQRSLGARIGVTSTVINKVERGMRAPSPAVADRLVAVLGQPAEELFTPGQLAELTAQ